jgi:DNA-binding transcriptional ArsR family regulator
MSSGRAETTSVFAALADPTRRQLVEWLSTESSGTATRFAERLPISRQAVARHLAELAAAGLVASHKAGRETRYSLNTEALQGAIDWLNDRARLWDEALDRLQKHLESP